MAPPTAMPAIAPVGSAFDECAFVGFGSARVGVRAAKEACWVK